MEKVCHWCREPLRWEPSRGWVHQEGGTCKMKCPDCGWEGAPYPSPAQCPHCGSKNVRDDHCVLPVNISAGGARGRKKRSTIT